MPKANIKKTTSPVKPKFPIIIADVENFTSARGEQTKVYVITVFSDEKASKTMVDWTNAKGNNPFKQARSAKAVTFKIPAEALNKFVNSNMYRVLEGALKYNGFTIDQSAFITSVEREVKNDVSSDDMGKLDSSLDNLMNDMLDHFEGKISDPMVEKIISQMHMFDPYTGKFKSMYELQTKTMPSQNNIMRMCAQWKNQGRSGFPTYVATRAQWRKAFNRYIVNDAQPLVIATPNDNETQAKRKTLNDFGLSFSDYRQNAHVRNATSKYYVDHGSAKNAENGFHGEYVYDVTDTEVIPGEPDLFNDNAGLESNIWADKWNQKAVDAGITPENVKGDEDLAASAGFTSNDENLEKVKNSLNIWCNENPELSKNVQGALERGNIVDAVKEYFGCESFIDREKSPNVKNAILNMCVFAALNHYGIAPADMLKSFKASRDYLTNNNKIPKSVRIKFMPFYSNFVNMIETNAKKTQQNECKEYGKVFSEMWNKIIDINKRNERELFI